MNYQFHDSTTRGASVANTDTIFVSLMQGGWNWSWWTDFQWHGYDIDFNNKKSDYHFLY